MFLIVHLFSKNIMSFAKQVVFWIDYFGPFMWTRYPFLCWLVFAYCLPVKLHGRNPARQCTVVVLIVQRRRQHKQGKKGAYLASWASSHKFLHHLLQAGIHKRRDFEKWPCGTVIKKCNICQVLMDPSYGDFDRVVVAEYKETCFARLPIFLVA